MHKFLNVALIICVGMCTAIVSASKQPGEQSANGKPAATLTTAKSAATTATAATAIHEPLGLLPASDVIAVIDAGRAFNELLPQQSSSQRADAVTGDPENLKRFVGAWKQEPPPDPINDVAQTLTFKIEGGKLICMERQLSYRYVKGEFFRDHDEFRPTGELKVKGKTVSWRARRLKNLGEGVDIQTRVTLTSDNEAVMDYIGEIVEGDQPLMLSPYRLTLKKQP